MRFIVMRLENLAKMALKRIVTGLGALALYGMAAGGALAASPGKEFGTWFDDSGDGAIKIEPCGDKLCGKIVWLKEPLNDKGEPLHDAHNPDTSLRKRTICGIPLLGGLARQEDGTWDAGWVYDPKEGKSYSFSVKLIASDRLEVTGYLGVKLLGRSMVWTRAPADLPVCTGTGAGTQAAAPAAKAPPPQAAGAAAGAAKPAAAAAAKAAPAAGGDKLPWTGKAAPPPPARVGGPKR
jgi:uncharacterized protein (DUF2147 family)